METLSKNQLAYFDCFAGLVPCKVLSITGRSGIASSMQIVTFKVTKKVGAYNRDEILQESALHVIPRKSVHYRSGQHARIRPYRVQTDTETV